MTLNTISGNIITDIIAKVGAESINLCSGDEARKEIAKWIANDPNAKKWKTSQEFFCEILWHDCGARCAGNSMREVLRECLQRFMHAAFDEQEVDWRAPIRVAKKAFLTREGLQKIIDSI